MDLSMNSTLAFVAEGTHSPDALDQDKSEDSQDQSSTAPPVSAMAQDGSQESEPKKPPEPLEMEGPAGKEAPSSFHSGKGSEHSDQGWDDPKGPIGWFAGWINNHYYINMVIVYTCILIATAVVLVAPSDDRCIEGKTGQLQLCEESSHDWELNFRDFSKFKDSVDLSRTTGDAAFKSKYTPEALNQEIPPRTQVSKSHQFYYLYFNDQPEDTKDSSIFTPKKVKVMCELESLIVHHPFYPYFCQIDDQGNCLDQEMSLVQYFYPTPSERNVATGGCAELAAADVERIAKEDILADFDSTGFHVAYDAVVGGHTNTTRSMIRLGSPLPGYKDENDKELEQFKLVELFLVGVTCPMPEIVGYTGEDLCAGRPSGERVKGVEELLFDRFDMKTIGLSTPYNKKPEVDLDGEPNLEIRFFSIATQQNEFRRAVNGDLSFAILSVMVVWCYIGFHTRSVFLANMLMLQIVMAIPTGFFLYYNLFQIHYWSQMNILVIYLALGIGADSAFVMNDSWIQSGSNPHIKTTQGRIYFSLSRTVIACFNTTVTTVMSFIATTVSPIMPIYAFASFASVVLVVNYVLICTLLPSVVMIYHVHWSDTGGACCYCSKAVPGRFGAKEPDARTDMKEMRERDRCYSCMPYANQEVPPGILEAARNSRQMEDGQDISRLTWIERFFHNNFAPVICGTEKRGVSVVPVVCIVLFLGYAVAMASQAFQLKPPVSQEAWFPDRHMLGGDFFDRLMQNWKGAADSEYMRLVFAFGIETVDRSGFEWLFPDKKRGQVVYDQSFDLKKAESQEFFLKVCNDIDSYKCAASACRDETLTRKGEKSVCVLRDMLDMYKNGGLSYSDANASVIPEDKFDQLYEDFFTNPNLPDIAAMQDRRDQFLTMIGRYDNDYRWALIDFKSSIIVPLFNEEAHDVYDEIQALTNELALQAPEGMRTLFQTDTELSHMGWTWMEIEDALIDNLLRGFSICFPVAFVVLLLATGNVLIALYATSTLAFIVAGVLGAAKLYYGWHLGIAESIAGVIVIGFSVDYTVHLGHMYREAPHAMTTREERVKYSLTYMGGTVLGGGITTLGAGVILFLCTLTFFTKMAVLLVWTILLSTLYSLFYFMPLCAVTGPENDFGGIPSIAVLRTKFGGGL
mmetsp:Transcript_48112/g.75144  ORF Transcript_48112/g.75144 Transcript_48112/m.75144 type:complete len:1138 (+) Transcript_48112:214-3627(+)